jgi:hypothetical protein
MWRTWTLGVAVCVGVAAACLLLATESSSGNRAIGHALIDQRSGFNYTSQSLVNAPDDFAVGPFVNGTTSSVEITGISLSSEGNAFSKYRMWLVNYCSPGTGLLIQFNGDPRVAADVGESPPPKVHRSRDVIVPPSRVRAIVPSGYGSNCLTRTGSTPLYYIDEVIPRDCRGQLLNLYVQGVTGSTDQTDGNYSRFYTS